MSKVLGLAEKVGVVPTGTNGVSGFLMTGTFLPSLYREVITTNHPSHHAAAEALSAGGQQDLFTPMFFHLARKPLEKDE